MQILTTNDLTYPYVNDPRPEFQDRTEEKKEKYNDFLYVFIQ